MPDMHGNILLDRFKGALTGGAVGDALGAPLRGLEPSLIRREYGEVTDFLEGKYGPGRITDDTQMAVVVAQSIAEFGRFDLYHTAEKFGRWMKLSDEGVKVAKEAGMACATAGRNLYRGASPEHSGVPSGGCGAAVRAAPIGLRYYHQPEELAEAAAIQATITHTDSEAVAGSLAVAFAVAAGIRDRGGLEPASFLDAVSGAAGTADQGLAERLAGLLDHLGSETGEGFRYTGNSAWVMEAVPAAFYAFLESPYHPEKTITTAVNAGGESSSIGAVAGALSGAFNGADALPARWRDRVEGKEYIEDLGFRLFTLTPAVGRKKRAL